METEKIVLTAVCMFGLEGLLGEEIDGMGFRRIENLDGRIMFEASINDIPRVNIGSRFAERILIQLGRFSAHTFDELFEGTKALPWEEWISPDGAFPVKGHSIKSSLFSIPDCQKIVKKAIAVRLGEKYGRVSLPETGTLYQVVFFIFKDIAYLMIDTSGEGLYKRGYRPVSTDAPLRETLAAAMVKLSRPRENVLLWDPMCGSGTIAAEAALMMTDTAPGLNRKFASEKYSVISERAWKDAREEARSAVHSSDFEAFASDIDPKAVEIAGETIKRAGMESVVRVFEQDALKITSQGRRGTIVCNPPYGERLMNVKEAEELYRKMGRHFSTLERWKIYILSSHEQFEKFYGKHADKVRKLYNGMIKCGFYQYFKE
ncbi:MAG: class I SAM-dependent RNA methyltransferase [Firmicutes bacterium]|nr:class I SAM-dependent RNA methyltransferase [Bacillota bacterium]